MKNCKQTSLEKEVSKYKLQLEEKENKLREQEKRFRKEKEEMRYEYMSKIEDINNKNDERITEVHNIYKKHIENFFWEISTGHKTIFYDFQI